MKVDDEEEDGSFELPYQVTEDVREGNLLDVFPSRADEALKTCEYTEQINQIMH